MCVGDYPNKTVDVLQVQDMLEWVVLNCIRYSTDCQRRCSRKESDDEKRGALKRTVL